MKTINRTEDIVNLVMKSADISEFQRKVYLELLKVPEGETISYKELGARIGCQSPQAIGQALKRNPFAPNVPCHRVISSNGTIGGYHGCRSGEMIEAKKAMLEKENAILGRKV